MKELSIAELFDLEKTAAKPLLQKLTYPWEALPLIKDFIIELGNSLSTDEYYSPTENVWIAKDATVAASAVINAPCIIGNGAEIRHCAFIRGSAIVGSGAVVGNSCELKNCILFDKVQVPHFNYVGDSILGFKSHMGAGSITSNVKSDKSLVVIRANGREIETGRKKVGAMVGDLAEVGCGCVLNPGTVIGRGSRIYPLCSVRGAVPPTVIYKDHHRISLCEQTKGE